MCRLIQIKVRADKDDMLADGNRRGCVVMWSSTRILWDQQILLLWILLPPIFAACVGSALAAPFLVRQTQTRETGCDDCVSEEPVAETAR